MSGLGQALMRETRHLAAQHLAAQRLAAQRLAAQRLAAQRLAHVHAQPLGRAPMLTHRSL